MWKSGEPAAGAEAGARGEPPSEEAPPSEEGRVSVLATVGRPGAVETPPNARSGLPRLGSAGPRSAEVGSGSSLE